MKKLQKQTRKEDSKVCSYGYDIWTRDGNLAYCNPTAPNPYAPGMSPLGYTGCWVESF